MGGRGPGLGRPRSQAARAEEGDHVSIGVTCGPPDLSSLGPGCSSNAGHPQAGYSHWPASPRTQAQAQPGECMSRALFPPAQRPACSWTVAETCPTPVPSPGLLITASNLCSRHLTRAPTSRGAATPGWGTNGQQGWGLARGWLWSPTLKGICSALPPHPAPALTQWTLAMAVALPQAFSCPDACSPAQASSWSRPSDLAPSNCGPAAQASVAATLPGQVLRAGGA